MLRKKKTYLQHLICSPSQGLFWGGLGISFFLFGKCNFLPQAKSSTVQMKHFSCEGDKGIIPTVSCQSIFYYSK